MHHVMRNKHKRHQPRIYSDSNAGPVSKAMPLFAMQPILRRIVRHVAQLHPELFERLGDSCSKQFLIDAKGMPFLLLLRPDPENLMLVAKSRHAEIPYDVLVSGKFVTLLRMIDSKTDSDALFFNRDIAVTGDTEAIVALRNALDDMDATLADDVATAFGPLRGPVRASIDAANKIVGSKT